MNRSATAFANWLEGLPGWQVTGLAESPITGPEGNKEFLIAGLFTGARDE